MYDLEHFGLRQMIESSRALRQLGQGCESLEDAAGEVVDFLFDSFQVPESGEPACVLVRCFKTHRFGELTAHLQDVACAAMRGAQPEAGMPCLTLLATRGIQPQWNSRYSSAGHQAIPLTSAEMLQQAPMIARLVEQLGLNACDVVTQNIESLLALERSNLDVFHVEHARKSAFVPAQENFVVPFGVRSVLGFGGVLPTGDLFFILLFARVTILPETAEMFRTLALGIKLVLLPHLLQPVFAP